MVRSVQDQELVRRFLKATERLSLAEAGDAVGLSGERIRQYKAGEWSRLNAATRRAMEAYLDTIPAREYDYRDGVLFAIERMEGVLRDLRDLVRSPAEIGEASDAVRPPRPHDLPAQGKG